jgi:hypothetical protein
MDKRTAVLASVVAILVACSSPGPPETAGAGEVRLDLGFSCLWWSTAQMEGMNPNAPPPKNTEVRISKWEYSDPIGVPHPDVVDVVITLTNGGRQAVANLEVEVAGQWRRGPLPDAAQAAWGERAVLKRFQNVNVPAAGSQNLRLPVDLKTMMEALEKEQLWPHALRVTVSVRLPGKAQPLAQAQAELPIMPGD